MATPAARPAQSTESQHDDAPHERCKGTGADSGCCGGKARMSAQLAQDRVVAAGFESLVAVQHRHFDIEQDDVRRLVG